MTDPRFFELRSELRELKGYAPRVYSWWGAGKCTEAAPCSRGLTFELPSFSTCRVFAIGAAESTPLVLGFGSLSLSIDGAKVAESMCAVNGCFDLTLFWTGELGPGAHTASLGYISIDARYYMAVMAFCVPFG